MLRKFRSAVQARDYATLAPLLQDYKNVVQLSDREIYRIALSAEPDLSLEQWIDIVKTAEGLQPAPVK